MFLKTSMPSRCDAMKPWPSSSLKGCARTRSNPSAATAAARAFSISCCAAQQVWLADNLQIPAGHQLHHLHLIFVQRLLS